MWGSARSSRGRATTASGRATRMRVCLSAMVSNSLSPSNVKYTYRAPVGHLPWGRGSWPSQYPAQCKASRRMRRWGYARPECATRRRSAAVHRPRPGQPVDESEVTCSAKSESKMLENLSSLSRAWIPRFRTAWRTSRRPPDSTPPVCCRRARCGCPPSSG